MIPARRNAAVTRRTTFVIAPLCLAFTGCDAATEIVGDTVETELRRGIVGQCEQVAEGAGIAAGRIAAVCQCSADTFVADGTLALSDISPERLQSIVESCVAETDPDGVGQ